MLGRLSDSQIAGKHPSGADRRACRANPLGQPSGARAGRTFCDPRNSCGDTNGSTLHVAKQVRGIQNPQSCRQAHRKSHLSGAPLLHLNRPDSLVFRLPTPGSSFQVFHPPMQVRQRVARSVALTDRCGRPATDLIDDVRRTFTCAEPVSKTVPEGVDYTSLRYERLHPLVQRVAGIVCFALRGGAVSWKQELSVIFCGCTLYCPQCSTNQRYVSSAASRLQWSRCVFLKTYKGYVALEV